MPGESSESEERRPQTSEATLVALWRQFTAEFATEADCLEELYERALDEGVVQCRYCGGIAVQWIRGERTIRCTSCKKRSWITSGTFFHRIRLARPWLAAIWLMERGVSLSSSRFHKLLDIAYSSALNIFRKLTTVIRSQMGEGTVAVPSSLFSPLICNRSRETPSKAHPIAEQEEMEKASVGADNLASVVEAGADEFDSDDPDTAEPDDSSELSAEERLVYDLIPSEPVHFDVLCASSGLAPGKLASTLTMLELAGVVTPTFGARYVRAFPGEKESSCRVLASHSSVTGSAVETIVVGAVIDFVRLVFQGISRKYLQNYLAACWCHTDRLRWSPRALMRACLGSGPIKNDEILEYVSPLVVAMPAPSLISARPKP